MIRLFPAPVCYASLQKHRLQLPFVVRLLDGFQHSRVREGRDGIRFARKGDLVGVFDDAAFIDGFLGRGEIFVVKGEEGDVIGDLVLDSPDSGVGDFGLGFAVEEGVDLGGGEHVVDVAEVERFGWG